MTEIATRPARSSIERSSSVVLPAPGALTKFSAAMSRQASQARMRRAILSFLAISARSSSNLWTPLSARRALMLGRVSLIRRSVGAWSFEASSSSLARSSAGGSDSRTRGTVSA